MAIDSKSVVTPYKGLVPYAEEDAEYFFGRDAEQRIVSSNLRASRLTLLFGDSGVGKTSLLSAGVARKLRKDPSYAVVVFKTWQGDPVGGLKKAFSDAETGLADVFRRAPRSDLSEALTLWSIEIHPKNRRTLLVILDQFEEF